MAGDTVARSVNKFIYIRVGGQILRIYPPLNKPKTLAPIRGTCSALRQLLPYFNDMIFKLYLQRYYFLRSNFYLVTLLSDTLDKRILKPKY
jgi:hypothetical protein